MRRASTYLTAPELQAQLDQLRALERRVGLSPADSTRLERLLRLKYHADKRRPVQIARLRQRLAALEASCVRA